MIEGWDKTTVQGKLMNKKNQMWRNTDRYIHGAEIYCALYGRFYIWHHRSKWRVRPCEILDKPLGNVRDFDLDFMSLWQSQKAKGLDKRLKM